jgi:anti-anti-sigma regulatory factor
MSGKLPSQLRRRSYDFAGRDLRTIREKPGLTMGDVETASEQLARKHNNEEYLITTCRLSDFETKVVLPGIHHLYSNSGSHEKMRTMLKITRIDTETEQRLILEGRLTEPWIADLRSHWEETRHAHPERKFLVDLRGVVRFDSAGEGSLALMKTKGAEFLASGIRMKHLVKELETEAQQKATVEDVP